MASFACLGTIAMGILTILSFSCASEVWGRYQGWLRTLRSNIPSVAVVKSVLACVFPNILSDSGRFMGFNFIKSWLRNDKFIYQDIFNSDDEGMAA